MDTLIDRLHPYLSYFGEHAYLQAIAVIIIGYFIAKLVNWGLSRLVHLILKKTRTLFDDHVVELLRGPAFASVFLVALSIAAVLVLEGSMETATLSLFKSVAVVIWTLFLLQLARLILRAMSGTPDRFAIIRSQTLPLFENLALLVIIGAAIYFLFTAWNIDMTAWLASAGIVGIAIGFAAKDTLANLFSGVFILADAPYQIGDYVVLDSGERGEVTQIGLRSTRLLTRDDVEVTIPNSIMGNTKVINESGGPHKKFRIRLKVGVAYGSDIDQVRAVLMDVAQQDEGVCDNPEPRVRFRTFGASSLDFELLGWVDEPSLRGRILDSLNGAVYKRFRQEGIEIPYAKQDVYIKSLPGSVQE